MMRNLLVFLTVAVSDGIWTAYIVSTSEHRALTASLWSALLVLASWYIVISYQKDKRMIIPAILGAFVGTYLTLIITK